MTPRRKKLLPAVLALTASSCNCGPQPCDPRQQLCKPDGGLYCPSGCDPDIGTDGGVQYDANGQVICLC